MPQLKKIVKFGLICNSDILLRWQLLTIKKALEIDRSFLSLIIIENSSPSINPSYEFKKNGHTISKLSHKFRSSRTIGLRWIYSTHSFNPEQICQIDSDASKIYCKNVSESHDYTEFSGSDIDKIRSYNLDFIIKFTSSNLKGDILDAPRLGIWTYYFGGSTNSFQKPPAFWEIYKGNDITIAGLYKLSEKKQEMIILRQGFFKNINNSYSATLEFLFTQCSRWVAQSCIDILHNVSKSQLECFHESEPHLQGLPTNFQCLLFLLKLSKNKFINFFKNFFSHRHWGLAVASSQISRLALYNEFSDINILPEPPKSIFRADPFGIQYEDGIAMLHEKCVTRNGTGSLACIYLPIDQLLPGINYLKKQSCINMPVNIRFPRHVSYPYIFTCENSYFCVPETSEEGIISLYRNDGDPSVWTYITDIITDFPAVDSTIFYFQGRWWLFCTQLNDNPNSHLYIWYADDIFGPWQTHKNNPVKMDFRSARPAGTPFLHQGQLYRPTQDCSRNYGGSITIQKIIDLSPTTFSEQQVADLKALAGILKVDGMHTISKVGDFTLLDYYHTAFLPGSFLYRMKLYMASKFKRQGNP